MDAERHQRAKSIFIEACDIATADRAGFLDHACASDPELRAEVELLLSEDDEFQSRGDDAPAVGESRHVASEDAASDPIPGFRVLERVGEGGMGVVYVAEQQQPVRRRVALKLIRPGLDAAPAVVARFESERQALAMMDHECIARVYEAGATSRGRPYFAMEYVAGLPVTQYCDAHRLTLRERLELFVTVCDAVQHAHQRGVIHRDLKPSNVLVVQQGQRALPKIIDFGIAKAIGRPLTDHTLVTLVGQPIGTPEYMSPEQTEPFAVDIDTRTDVYSLGVLLYELLVGARPFTRDETTGSFDALRRRIREEEPKAPSTRLGAGTPDAVSDRVAQRSADLATLTRDLRGDLDWVTLKALEKDRTRRYESPRDLAEDVRRHLRHLPVQAGPPSLRYRIGKLVRRNRVVFVAAAIVALAVTLGAVGTAVGFVRALRSEERALAEAETANVVAGFLESIFQRSDPRRTGGEEETARQILDRASRRIRAELADQPDAQARLMSAIGEVYLALGLMDEAEPLLSDALQLRRRESEPNPAALGAALSAVAELEIERGDYESAVGSLREAVRVLGPTEDGRLVARVEDQLGRALWFRGEYEEAEAQVRRALVSYESMDHAERADDVAQTQHTLAMILRERDDLAEAERLCVAALSALRSEYGEQDYRISGILYDLGLIYQEKGEFGRAETHLRQALEMDRDLLGDEHPDVSTGLYSLGTLLSNAGRPGDAEPILREVLARDIAARSPDHSFVALSMNNLAGALMAQGKLEEAEKYYRDALAIHEQVDPQHPETATTCSNLATLFARQGRYEEAEEYGLRALQIRERLGRDHAHFRVSQRQLASILHEQGKSADAEPLVREILAAERESTRGPKSPGLAAAMHLMVVVLRGVGKLEEAVPLARENLELHEAIYQRAHPRTRGARLILGRILLESDRATEAEALVREHLEASTDDAESQRVALALWAEVLQELGRFDEEARVREQLEAADEGE